MIRFQKTDFYLANKVSFCSFLSLHTLMKLTEQETEGSLQPIARKELNATNNQWVWKQILPQSNLLMRPQTRG